MIAAPLPPGRRADDRRERGRDEQGVAEAPAGAEADDGIDAAAQRAEQGEHDDQAEPDQQRRLGADAARHEARHEHREPGHEQVAREEQLGLHGGRLQLLGDRGEDRVDEPDAHERDDARERDGPHLRIGWRHDARGRCAPAHRATSTARGLAGQDRGRDAQRLPTRRRRGRRSAAASAVASAARASGERLEAGGGRADDGRARVGRRPSRARRSPASTIVPTSRVMPGWVTRLRVASSPSAQRPVSRRMLSVRHCAAGASLRVSSAAMRVRACAATMSRSMSSDRVMHA